MGAPELLALSLGLSVAVAALGLAGGTIIERLSADPGLRDRVWGVALLLPVLPPVATALLLITPAPVREIASAPMGPVITVVAPTSMPTAPTSPSGLELDGGLIATVVIAIAVLLAILRIAALMLRTRRLSLLIRAGETPDAGTMETVRDAARGLAISPPPVVVSAATPEALLAGLRPARLVLPLRFIAGDTGVTRAVIAHELAHLKRGDHRALWVEELVLALLAANPLMPLLRVRRAAAREEACDAIALADAPAETRRAYAQTLIEALRNRAGPQSPGLMPALTFTGAGRTTAMHRLKAVLTPATPADRRARLITAAAGVVLLAATGVTTAALAGQREAEVRLVEPQSGEHAQPKSVPQEFRINGQRIAINPSTLPPFGFAGEAIRYADGRSTEAPAWVDVTVSLDPAAPPLSLEGAPLPRGVKADVIMPEFVERIDRTGAGLNIVLKRDDAQQSPQAPRPLSPDQQARYRNLSAQGYREVCASNDPVDDGFCAGVMFAQIDKTGVCPSAEAMEPGADRRAALAAYVEGGRRVMRRLTPRTDEGAHGYAERAMAQAFPCRTAQSAQPARGSSRLTVQVSQTSRPMVIAEGDVLRVVLESQDGGLDAPGVIAHESPISRTQAVEREVGFDLSGTQLPSMTRGRTYRLTAELRDLDGRVRYAAEPATVRLAPGSNLTRLRPELVLEPVS